MLGKRKILLKKENCCRKQNIYSWKLKITLENIKHYSREAENYSKKQSFIFSRKQKTTLEKQNILSRKQKATLENRKHYFRKQKTTVENRKLLLKTENTTV